MGRDGIKFLLAVAFTLLLSGLVILSGYKRDRGLLEISRVDIEKIHSMVSAGELSIKDAEFYELVEDAAR
jgi:hypothetical protein